MRIQVLLALLILAGAPTVATAVDPPAAQAIVKIKVIEVDLAKVRKLGVELRTPEGSQSFDPVEELRKPRIFNANEPVRGFLHACERQQMATILAEPTLSLTLDKPALFTAGGEFPVPSGQDGKEVTWRRYGTEAEALVHERGNNEVAVSFKIRLAEIDRAHEITVGDKKVPGLTTFDSASAFEARWDDTALFSGPPVADKSGQKRELLRIVLVTPSRLDAVAAQARDVK